MKAMVNEQYGPPDVMELREIDKPVPVEDEVLVKIMAASVNAYDWRLLRADPFLARLDRGLIKPRNKILGADIAGVVEAVGGGVTSLQVGDEVFGDIASYGDGGFAEYVCVPEAGLVHKPVNLTFEEAAAIPMAALTALNGLRKGNLQPGQSVLIHGASGGVGTFAVQLAKEFGAEVTALCSTKKVEQARSLGADHVIDYTKEDFLAFGDRFD